MSASTIGPVLAALHDIWKAGMPADTQVVYGPRQVITVTKSKLLCITDVDFTNEVSTMDDDWPMDEVYDVQCVAEATIQGTKDQQVAVEAVLGIYGQAVAILRARPDETLGVPAVQSARPIGRGRLLHSRDQAAIKTGRSAAIPFTIRVRGVL